MEWTAEGLLIGVRRHGESSVVAEAVLVDQGRWLGLIRGGRSSRNAPGLQPGNTMRFTWRARLEDHLGSFTCEVIEARAASLIEDRGRLYLAQLVFEHLRLLPEREPHNELLAKALSLIDRTPDAASVLAFERDLLDELGFGLDLDSCAATGVTEDLAYISPKSGRAVSRTAGEPYADRLLPLPSMLAGTRLPNDPDEIEAAFSVTGYFLDAHLWQPRRLSPPPTRAALIAILAGKP
jgi:DNA repair protein RecO (recombination protein O)